MPRRRCPAIGMAVPPCESDLMIVAQSAGTSSVATRVEKVPRDRSLRHMTQRDQSRTYAQELLLSRLASFSTGNLFAHLCTRRDCSICEPMAYHHLVDRECNTLPASRFASLVSSPDARLVDKLQHRTPTLQGHDGCVNTVSFTDDGERLISGSDDQSIVVWDWKRGARLRTWPALRAVVVHANTGNHLRCIVMCFCSSVVG